jgi:hypothetical protein
VSRRDPFPRRHLLRSAAAAGLAVAAGARADEPPRKAPEARPGDVATIDAIVAALYDVISGPKGQARDWDRMRGLFAPGARLIPCLPKDDAGRVATRVLTVEDYVTRAGPSIEKTGFFEREVARKVDRFGHIAQVFSTYESRAEKGAEPFARGINSIQLFWDETRWWVVTIFWDAESPANPIPPEYRAKP